MPYMMPVAAVVGTLAGVVAGHYAKKAAKERGWSADSQDLAARIAHWAASTGGGFVVGNIIDPVTPFAHGTTTAILTANHHDEMVEFMSGRGRLPSTR